MRMLRAPGLALTAALLACALAGCSDADGKEAEPEPTATVSVSPSPSEPTEPTLSTAAKTADEAGAKAFIAHYWDLVNYAQQTGDVETLESITASTCDICNGFVEDLKELLASGGRLEGGENSVEVTATKRINASDPSVLGFQLKTTVAHTPQVIVDGNGSRDSREAGTMKLIAYVQWIEDRRWRLDILDVP
ncbi:hypothetical protein KG112_05430 [Nocardioides sp. zg-ZUI104]|uniref:DUF6318 family protein n=1 Tax=Nocardioides faecalis TaxID=2803858 RepID=UPI001BCC17D5|nr:DUF6318 family protein [Nocardioides faecalis]MBS4752248.1 hypothetical protein [Nocardioides faecalis]